jgi:hypothetical protein
VERLEETQSSSFFCLQIVTARDSSPNESTRDPSREKLVKIAGEKLESTESIVASPRLVCNTTVNALECLKSWQRDGIISASHAEITEVEEMLSALCVQQLNGGMVQAEA